MRKALAAISIGIALLVTIVLIRAAFPTSLQVDPLPAKRSALDDDAMASRLGEALRIPTISHLEESQRDAEAFLSLHALLESQFPRVHKELERETVSELSLLYRWEGREPGLAPVLLAAHTDVVPVEPGTEADWEHPAFSGAVTEGAIWGRGALDDKINVLAQLEAVESLLAEGFQPRRTIYLAFGHDEEVGGNRGAAVIAKQIASRGETLAFVLDEGGALTPGLVPGIEGNVAIVGVAEKGYVSFDLVAHGSGGHSSMPPRDQSVVILSHAISRIDANRPPARLTDATRSMLETLAPESQFGARVLLANLWLFEPLLLRLAAFEPSANALVRSTTAPTLLSAGVKDNVVPGTARATVNYRILPGDSSAGIARHLDETIQDERVEIIPRPSFREPSRASTLEGPAFNLLASIIRGAFPATVVTPYLVAGGTDARHYRDLSPNVYRFSPIPLRPGDRERLHGTGERISVDDYIEAVHFYRALIPNLDRLPDAESFSSADSLH